MTFKELFIDESEVILKKGEVIGNADKVGSFKTEKDAIKYIQKEYKGKNPIISKNKIPEGFSLTVSYDDDSKNFGKSYEYYFLTEVHS